MIISINLYRKDQDINSKVGYVYQKPQNFTMDKVIVIVDTDDNNHFIQSKSAISWRI